MSLRFDGLYVQVEAGGAEIIRFTPGGDVVTASVSHEGDLKDVPADGIASWLLPGKPGLSQGTFALELDQVAFSSTSQEGTVEYRGTVDGAGAQLHLRYRSLINGNEGDGTWVFVEVPSPTPAPASGGDESSGEFRAAGEDVLRPSTRLSQPGFAGLIDRYIGSQAEVLKAGDGDLYTVGQPNEYFNKCAFVLTSTKLWAFRGAGMLGGKKPASINLREVEKVALTRMSALGKDDEVGITLGLGAQTFKGGPETFTASLVARWQLQVADHSWAAAISQACEALRA
jgi:hypothetical protein